MKLELKAYKAIYSGLCYYSDNPFEATPQEYEVIYGSSQEDAIDNACNDNDSYGYFELKQSIETRRFVERDLYSVNRSKLLDNLTDKQINHLTHSLGVSINDVYQNKFSRNFSAYNKRNDDCDTLVLNGLMDYKNKLDSHVYTVSKIGIEAVKTLLLVTSNYK